MQGIMKGIMKGLVGGLMFWRVVFISSLLLFTQTVPAQEAEQNAGQPIEVEQVHINQADVETIAQVLDGVGMSRAEAIVSWRQEFGDFESLDDLMLVNGIGELTVQRNQHRILFD